MGVSEGLSGSLRMSFQGVLAGVPAAFSGPARSERGVSEAFPEPCDGGSCAVSRESLSAFPVFFSGLCGIRSGSQ